MDKDDMIIPEGDAPVDASQNNDDNAQPTAPTEPDGVLLDNDEVQDEQAKTDAESVVHESEQGEATVGGEKSTEVVPPGREAKTGENQLRSETASANQPAAQLEDPGEFQPKDYSFDITLADGSVIKIEKPEDIDNVPQDADFGTPANLAKMNANYTRMVVGLDADKREYEAGKEAYDKQVAESADIEQRITTTLNEMAYLEKKGKLPAVDEKYNDANWSDPEVAKQPGVKERLDLLAYRAKENEERTKLGLSPMSLLEAHMQMGQDAAVQKAADEKKQQGEQRKAKGSMIGGATASHFDSTPDDMIVGEGGSIRDIGL